MNSKQYREGEVVDVLNTHKLLLLLVTIIFQSPFYSAPRGTRTKVGKLALSGQEWNGQPGQGRGVPDPSRLQDGGRSLPFLLTDEFLKGGKD